jgi:hypothetical protein
MRKNPASHSGIFNPRILLAFSLCLTGVILAVFAQAAPSRAPARKLNRQRHVEPDVPTPSNGTVSPANPTLTYTGGPFVAPNVTGNVGNPDCTAPMSCDDFILSVNMNIPPGGPDPDPNKHVKISVGWPVTAADFDLYVYQNGIIVGSSATSADPEVVILPAQSALGANAYTIRVVPFAPAGQSYTATVTLETNPPPPPPGSAAAPRYQNYTPNPADLGGAGSAGEPSIGIDWTPHTPFGMSLKHGTVNSGGIAFFTANLNEYRVSFDDCSSPAKNPNTPAGTLTNAPLWEDVTNSTEKEISLDPIGFVDHQTGRVFQSQLAGATSIMSFSDNDGGVNGQAVGDWTQSQGSGQPAGVDHETVGGGPYNASALPPPPPHPLYANQVYYASQDVGTAFAARSDTGGATFGPGIPMWNLTQCGGLHGHVKVGPDGTVYVPNKSCGADTGVAVSMDNGLTWTVHTIPNSGAGSTDPSVGIGADNTVYLGYQGGDGHPHCAVSTDHGTTWHDVDVGQGIIAHTVFAEVVAGDGDRAAFGFLGTSTSTGDCCSGGGIGSFRGVWYFYIATTFDRGQTYTLVNATGNDPVQVGSLCTGGTLCGTDRNLLDFNDLQIDSEGRVLAAYADGCVAPNCSAATANNPPDPTLGYTASRSALSSILRQSGGPRLLSAFDPNPPEPHAPAAPRVNSVTGAAGSNVHLDWSEPDHGGSDVAPPTPTAVLTGYKIYRRTDPGVYGAPLATVTLGCPACKTTYDDTTSVAGTSYFYKVTAVNAYGESANCNEFSVGALPVVEKACLLPGLTILTDATGDELDMVPAHDVQHLWIAEPVAFAPNQLVFTMKMQSLATVPPNSRWPITFTAPNNVNYTVRMTNSPPDYPVGCTTTACVAHTPIFQYGPTAGPFVTVDPTAPGNTNPSNFLPDGTITMVVPRSGIGNPQIGQSITGFLVRIVGVNGVGVTITPDNMPDNLGPAGSYTVVGNLPCNQPPIAALSANPLSGTPPLVVNFDASASTDPDAGDTIASYTFDFGDGSAPVTQAGATISHTYQSNGHFHATVRVSDNHGLASSNVAGVEIEVELPLDREVSRKVHGAVPGAFDVILFDPTIYPNGTGEIECRAPGPENDYTIIYTFGTEYTVSPTQPASSVTVDGNNTYVVSHGRGPGTNQYTVHVANNVPNAQHHTITLDGVPVTNSNKGNAAATLKNVSARFDLLVGDVNGSGLVDSGDVFLVRQQTGQNAGSSNFRRDVNASGVIDSGDVFITRQQTGTSLP